MRLSVHRAEPVHQSLPYEGTMQGLRLLTGGFHSQLAGTVGVHFAAGPNRRI
jgi:hypothetical protein